MTDKDCTPETIQIPTTRNQITFIDPEDADLALLKWCAVPRKSGGFYVSRGITYMPGTRQKNQFIHRVILSRMIGRELLRNELVDHINNNPLDNRRSNLRLATVSQNRMNASKHDTCTSKYKGVSWNKYMSKWKVSIQKDHKSIHLGYFESEELAYQAYCKKAFELHGEFARVA